MKKTPIDFKKYNFSDFTRENYVRLIGLAKEKYVFRSFSNFQHEERFILWRHDIDYSPFSARKLAKIECKKGVVATYFVHLHNIFYNVLEREVTDCITEILKMGHCLGLHFDCDYHEITDEKQLNEHLNSEASLLKQIFNQNVGVFSFHNPSSLAMSVFKKDSYSGMINAYSEYFQKEVGYCSDSNGFWRHRRLEDVLTHENDKRLQVLTHPAWWQDEAMPPFDKIKRCINGRAEKTQFLYETLLSKNKRLNVGKYEE